MKFFHSLHCSALIVLAVGLVHPAFSAEGDSLWSNTYGGSSGEGAQSVIETSDGGFLLAGNTESFASGMFDMWLVKTDAQGDSLWSNSFGGSHNDAAYSIIETSDGGFLLAGYTRSYGPGDHDMWLVKTNAQGDSLWSRTFDDGNFLDQAYSVIETGGSSYLIAGFALSIITAHYDMWLVKTDNQGDSLWSRMFDRGHDEKAFSLIETSDGGFLLAGSTQDTLSGNIDMLLLKTNAQGDSLWSNTFGGVDNEEARSVIETGDGGFLLAGYTLSFGSGSYDMWLVKTDAQGDMLWSRTFGGIDYDQAYCVIETSEDDFLVAGKTYSFGLGDGDMWLVCADGTPGGDLELSATVLNFGVVTIGVQAELPLTMYNVGTDPIIIDDIYSDSPCFTTDFDPADSLLAEGDTLEITVYFAPDEAIVYYNTLFIENDTEPGEVVLLGAGEEPLAIGTGSSSRIPDTYAIDEPYPNPFNPTTFIRFQLPTASMVELTVFDLHGSRVTDLVHGWCEAGYHVKMFNASNLPAGVYLYHMRAADFTASGRMVLLK